MFSNDIGATQLQALRDGVTKNGLTNVTVVEGMANATNLPAGCCDAILIRDAYHHFTTPADVLRSVVASLKPGGRLAIINSPHGRTRRYRTVSRPTILATVYTPCVVEREAAATGLQRVHGSGLVEQKVSPRDSLLTVFRKPS